MQPRLVGTVPFKKAKDGYSNSVHCLSCKSNTVLQMHRAERALIRVSFVNRLHRFIRREGLCTTTSQPMKREPVHADLAPHPSRCKATLVSDDYLLSLSLPASPWKRGARVTEETVPFSDCDFNLRASGFSGFLSELQTIAAAQRPAGREKGSELHFGHGLSNRNEMLNVDYRKTSPGSGIKVLRASASRPQARDLPY